MISTHLGPAINTGKPANEDLHWTETLADGTHVIVRPIGPADADLEREFIARLSPESQRLRFLGHVNPSDDALIHRFTDIDRDHEMAFIALVHRDGEKREIGVSRYSMDADGNSCECAIVVSDEWRGKGIGSLLMRHLIDVARTRGIRTMWSIDAADNSGMRDLAAHLGFTRERDPDDATLVIHTLAL